MMELVRKPKTKSAAQRIDAARNAGGVFEDGIHRRQVEGRIGVSPAEDDGSDNRRILRGSSVPNDRRQ
jgi:hypothetical protein